VVARIVGEELVVERYQLSLRSVRSSRYREEDLEEAVRRIRPHLVMWIAPDERGRRLAKALRERDGEAEWLPGCVELSGWTDAPFSELLKLMCQASEEEAAGPARRERREEVAVTTGEEAPTAREDTEARPKPGAARDDQGDELGERLEVVLSARARRLAASRG